MVRNQTTRKWRKLKSLYLKHRFKELERKREEEIINKWSMLVIKTGVAILVVVFFIKFI